MIFPGINRHQMPKNPIKNEPERKAEKNQIYSFISCSQFEFERRESILFFEKILKKIDSSRIWNLSDRVYFQKYDQNSL